MMIQSPLLGKLGIVHGYADRHTKPKMAVAVPQQVHGIRIAVVTGRDKGKTIPGVDGLVSKNIPIGVTFADCVPLLAVDPKARIIGAAHAGWKGTFAGIAKELIVEMIKNGAVISNLYISIGPHIGMCCYSVQDDRARAFQKKFGDNSMIAAKNNGAWHLDIGYVNYQTAVESGILKDHIEVSTLCTSCHVTDFHSFRKDTKKEFGVQMGVISV